MASEFSPERRFVNVNGLRLHYLDWGNQAAPPLVCVHGFRGNAHAFDGPARRFRDRFHVIAPDVRGRGDSAWSPAGAYQISDYVSDLEGLVDALGLAAFSLIGTSMGGRIGMTYAGRHPERLDRLVINDIGPDNEPGSDRITGEAASTPESFADLEGVIAYRARLNPALARLSDEAQREQALYHVRPLADGRWVWKMDRTILKQRSASGASGYPELWDALATFQNPVLLVWGEKSDVLSEAQAKKIIATLPNGEMVTVSGAGHAPTLLEPAAIEALDQFLVPARAGAPAS
jgi:pimeloyl-ACP methyl ester carboxylesterase